MQIRVVDKHDFTIAQSYSQNALSRRVRFHNTRLGVVAEFSLDIQISGFLVSEVKHTDFTVTVQQEDLVQVKLTPVHVNDVRHELDFELDRLRFQIPDDKLLIHGSLSKVPLVGGFPNDS